MTDSIISKHRSAVMGFAAVIIMLFHFFPCLYGDLHIPVISSLLLRGNIGVDIFLFLSGIGLYSSMSKDSSPLPFYQKRIRRVFIPALVISLPYWIGTDFLFLHKGLPAFLEDWSGLSYWTKGNGTVWYISLILVLYLFYPAIFRLTKDFVPKMLCLLGIVYAAVIAAFLFVPDAFALREAALTRIPVFLIGSLTGEMLLAQPERKKQIKSIILGYTVLMLILFAAAFCIPETDPDTANLLYRFGSGGTAILVSMLLAYFLEKCKPVHLENGLKTLGGISLELYLIHVFLKNLIGAMHLDAKSGASVQLCIIAAAIAVSVLLSIGAGKLERAIRNHFAAKPATDSTK